MMEIKLLTLELQIVLITLFFFHSHLVGRKRNTPITIQNKCTLTIITSSLFN